MEVRRRRVSSNHNGGHYGEKPSRVLKLSLQIVGLETTSGANVMPQDIPKISVYLSLTSIAAWIDV